MSRSKKLRILSYDISDNKCRRRVATLLEAEGTRVQYSVFEARLSDARLRSLVEMVEGQLDPGGSLRVYTVGGAGERQCSVIGTGSPVDKDAGYWLM